MDSDIGSMTAFQTPTSSVRPRPDSDARAGTEREASNVRPNCAHDPNVERTFLRQLSGRLRVSATPLTYSLTKNAGSVRQEEKSGTPKSRSQVPNTGSDEIAGSAGRCEYPALLEDHMRAHYLWMSFLAATVAACSPVQDRSSIAMPAAGRQATVGVGDIVFEIHKRESLPDEFGGADVFGRTRDTGRITLRYAGAQDGRAHFVRNDVTINTNETTLSYMPTYVPAPQYSTTTGKAGNQSFQSNTTTTGMIAVPPKPISRTVTQSGDISVSAPIGGTLMIAGHQVNVIAADASSITYTAN